MPIDSQTLEQLRDLLVTRAGGYLRNPIIERDVTCVVCQTPCIGYRWCVRCNNQRDEAGPRADQVASLTYAVNGRQSGWIMRGYKAPVPTPEHAQIVLLTTVVGLGYHGECAGNRLGAPVTHWTVVPSMPAKPVEHPMRRLAAPAAPGIEVQLIGAATSAHPREIDPEHYTSPPLPAGSHVLLIDDTWTGGGHAQSAVLAVRAAGAAYASVLNVARWIEPAWQIPEYDNNAGFLAQRCARDYDPMICPWTGASCS